MTFNPPKWWCSVWTEDEGELALNGLQMQKLLALQNLNFVLAFDTQEALLVL